MKQLIIVVMLLSTTLSKAQVIQSLSVIPANPTSNDSVRLLANCSFPSGSCDQHTQGFGITGNNISAWALHCVGMLAVICPHTDTINLGKLPAGTYILTFQLDMGALPSPCSPGMVAGPTSNLSFVVNTPNTIGEMNGSSKGLKLLSNPVGDRLDLQFAEKEDEGIEILDMQGRRLISVRSGRQMALQIPLNQLMAGIYYVRYKEQFIRFVKN